MTRTAITGCNVMITGDKKTPSDNAEETKENIVSALKLLRKTA